MGYTSELLQQVHHSEALRPKRTEDIAEGDPDHRG